MSTRSGTDGNYKFIVTEDTCKSSGRCDDRYLRDVDVDLLPIHRSGLYFHQPFRHDKVDGLSLDKVPPETCDNFANGLN